MQDFVSFTYVLETKKNLFAFLLCDILVCYETLTLKCNINIDPKKLRYIKSGHHNHHSIASLARKDQRLN